MSEVTAPTVLIVPGLREHMPDHWQTLLEAKLPKAVSVPRIGRAKACATWVAELDRSLSQIDGPVVLVAHSAGCLIVVHWAQQRAQQRAQQHRRAVKGALLATPPDFESPLPAGYPTHEVLQENDWLPTPRARLPFPSIVAASTNDPLARIDRVAALADAWGSRLVDVGAVGHLNPAAGYGPWSRAEEFISELAR